MTLTIDVNAFVAGSDAPLMLVDGNGSISAVSPGAERMVAQYPLLGSNLVGRHFDSSFAPVVSMIVVATATSLYLIFVQTIQNAVDNRSLGL